MRLDRTTNLYKNLEQKFGNVVKTQRTTETPSTPGFHVVRNIPNAAYITDKIKNCIEVELGCYCT